MGLRALPAISAISSAPWAIGTIVDLGHIGVT